jgi:cobyrinic acid a,c-diamide synthase
VGGAMLIAGTHSGCGKTTLSLGILAALQRRGVAVQPFKCGPDFIDPTLHRMVTGRISRNLDIRMCGADFVRRTFADNTGPKECAVVEGVMGLFDGGEGSAAHLAKVLNLPVILVIDVRSAAESVAAVVKGFASLDPDLPLAGIIANRVGSPQHEEIIRQAIREHCPIPLLGFLPRREEVAIPSRHLGLHMGDEHPLAGEGLDRLAGLIAEHLDLDLLVKIATARRPPAAAAAPPAATGGRTTPPPVRIGVARDRAFCFYYEDNLDLLRQAGAELFFFSPLVDRALPAGVQGLYLGGGYPELHAAQLSGNRAMREAIKQFSRSGRVVYAECGGFMYLTRAITDLAGLSHPMAGVLPMTTRMQPRLGSLGYRQPVLLEKTFLGGAGSRLFGHEYHYSVMAGEEEGVTTVYRLDDHRREGYLRDNTLAGYLHLHWGQTPQAAGCLVNACRQFQP